MERREHTRVSVEVKVDVTSGSNFFVGKMRDLSLGGLFIETPIALPIGACVSVQLYLKGTRHDLAAEIVWALDADDGATIGVGARLLNPPPRSRDAILAFMKERDPVEFEMIEPDLESSSTAGLGVEASRQARSLPPPLPVR